MCKGLAPLNFRMPDVKVTPSEATIPTLAAVLDRFGSRGQLSPHGRFLIFLIFAGVVFMISIVLSGSALSGTRKFIIYLYYLDWLTSALMS